jgi:hypothetical protein
MSNETTNEGSAHALTTAAEHALVIQIKEAHEETLRLRDETIRLAIATNAKARECGQYLLTAKVVVGASRWKDWVQTTLNIDVPESRRITPEMVSSYTTLAKQPAIEDANTKALKQACLFLAESQTTGKPPKERSERTTETSWIEAFNRVSYVFQDVIDKRPVAEWTEIERESYLLGAKPIVEAYVKLGGSLS